MLRMLKVPKNHPLHELAVAPADIPVIQLHRASKRPRSENIWLLKSAVDLITPYNLVAG